MTKTANPTITINMNNELNFMTLYNNVMRLFRPPYGTMNTFPKKAYLAYMRPQYPPMKESTLYRSS